MLLSLKNSILPFKSRVLLIVVDKTAANTLQIFVSHPAHWFRVGGFDLLVHGQSNKTIRDKIGKLQTDVHSRM